VGASQPVELLHFIKVLETALGKRAIMNLMPGQAGDLLETSAETDDLERVIGFRPSTPIEVGIRKFVQWYRAYYRI
jgi:UDP-glucuronate 4-epimerase